MSKKILSLALVVVMLMSMFAFSASAVELSAGQIGLVVESDAQVGAPAGTIVTVTAKVVVPANEDVQLTFAHISLGYDNTVFELVTDNSLVWGASYEACFQNTSTTMANNTTISNNIVKKFNANDKAQGWNAGVQIKQTPISGGEFTTKTGYPVDPNCELFTVKFKALKEIEAGDSIGAATGAYGSNFFNFKLFSESTTAGSPIDLANVVLTDSYAAPAAEVKVEHFDTMGQMGNWETLTGKFNGGLVGKISNLDLAFDGNECTNLLKIEVALTTATGSSKAEAYQVYEQADGSYLFRAVIKDMDITSEANISAVYTIYVDTDADGEADKTYSSEAVNVNAKGIYEEALANYKAA